LRCARRCPTCAACASLPLPTSKGRSAAATAHLPSLEALHVPFLSGMDAYPLPAWPNACPQLRELTLPRALVVAPSSTALCCSTGLSRLCIHGRGPIDLARIASLVAQLPALVALEQGTYGGFEGAAELRSLTQLTALKLAGAMLKDGEPNGPLLHAIAALTGLKSLDLGVCFDFGWDPAQPSWLRRLTGLTSLRVAFDTNEDEGLLHHETAGVFDEVAASVPDLPALCELHIADATGTRTEMWPHACVHIGAASSSLRRLTLAGLSLATSMFTEVIPQLTGLTCLCLNAVYHCRMSFDWLAALTNLRELAYVESSEHLLGEGGNSEDALDDGSLPCQLLSGLSSVVTLTLANCSFVDGPYLEELCECMPQLRSLDLRHTSVAGGLSALQRLTNLEVLGLEMQTCRAELLEQLRAPLNLRRCYLGEGWWNEKQRPAAVALLGTHVEVVFERWSHEWHEWHEWCV
jgi:hypothetical protein